jgi:hypothetical protein
MQWRDVAYRVRLATIKARVEATELPVKPRGHNTDRD